MVNSKHLYWKNSQSLGESLDHIFKKIKITHLFLEMTPGRQLLYIFFVVFFFFHHASFKM